jgi:hypothetical protein
MEVGQRQHTQALYRGESDLALGDPEHDMLSRQLGVSLTQMLRPPSKESMLGMA